MAWRNKSAGHQHIHLGQFGVLQQPPRLGDTQLHVITLRGGAQLFLEQPFQLSPGAPRIHRQLLQLQRLFEIGVHQLHHFTQRRTDTDVFGRFDPPVTRFLERQNVFDAFDQRLVVQTLDPVQRHVERPGRARCRQAVTVNHIGLAADLGGLGDFRQRRAMFRVNRTAIPFQHPCPPQKPGAIPQPGQQHARLGGHSQKTDELVAGLQFRAVAAADHQQVQFLQHTGFQTRVGADHQPQIADHLAVAEAESAGGKQPGAQQVGSDKGVQRLGEGRQGKVLQQHKPGAGHAPRPGGRFVQVAQVLALHATAELTSFDQDAVHLLLVMPPC